MERRNTLSVFPLRALEERDEETGTHLNLNLPSTDTGPRSVWRPVELEGICRVVD